jgi:hypothetical protein
MRTSRSNGGSPAARATGSLVVASFVFAVASFLWPAIAAAQDAPPASVSGSDEIEPHIVAHRGTTMVGFSGFIDRAFSTVSLMPLNYTIQAEGLRFLTDRTAVHFGVAGSGSIGGDNADSLATGTGAPALRLFVGGDYFLRPKSMLSPYGGIEYWYQLTQRASRDDGSMVGKLGFQAAVSSRAGVFVEGGYGFNVARGSEGELATRIVGQVGVRLRF